MIRSRSIRKTCVVLAVVLAAASAAFAEEILHFSNGLTLAIRSHVIEDGMIHVDLGGNGLIAFPAAQVERITKAGRDVYLPPSFAMANVATSGERSGGRVKVQVAALSTGSPVYGSDSAGGSSSRRASSSPKGDDIEALLNTALGIRAAQQRAGTGTAVAFPEHPNRSMRQLRVAGRGDAYRGADAQNGLVGSLGRTVSGEAKLITPEMAGKLGGTGKVKRFLPSDAVSQAAVADGKPLTYTPPPPASSGGDAGGSGSSGDSDQ